MGPSNHTWKWVLVAIPEHAPPPHTGKWVTVAILGNWSSSHTEKWPPPLPVAILENGSQYWNMTAVAILKNDPKIAPSSHSVKRAPVAILKKMAFSCHTRYIKGLREMRISNFVNFENLIDMKLYSLLILNIIQNYKKKCQSTEKY